MEKLKINNIKKSVQIIIKVKVRKIIKTDCMKKKKKNMYKNSTKICTNLQKKENFAHTICENTHFVCV